MLRPYIAPPLPPPRNPPSIEDVIAAIPEWRGRAVEAEIVHGGLTNRAYCVRVDGTPHFVSIPGTKSELLAIGRAEEIYNTRAAAETGIAPRVLHQLPESGVLVTEFLQGRTLSKADMHVPDMPSRLAAAVRRLHAARPFANDFDLFRLMHSYADVVAEGRMPFPAGYEALLPRLTEMEQAAGAHRLPMCPCSNDLVPENLIDDDGRLWIVDYGYSGNNDPCSELGNACCEADYRQAEMETLCAAYFGSAEGRLLARMHLYAIMSDVAWSLWSVIQERVSELSFDFGAYGQQRWERALGLLHGPDLADWIRQA
jgi:thiamine kinase-like enzyme